MLYQPTIDITTTPPGYIPDLSEFNVLYLNLSKEAFAITGTPEKMFELRNRSKWIDSRLFDKRYPALKNIDFVVLTETYAKNAPRKLFRFEGLEVFKHPIHWRFSNGLTFYTRAGDYKILLGEA